MAALRAHREAGGDLRHAVLIGLDLTSMDADGLLRGTPLDEALLLGCQLLPSSRERAEASAALVFPAIPDLPYQAYRSTLYTPDELFAGFDPSRPESYVDTLDARVYRHVAAVRAGRPSLDRPAPPSGRRPTLLDRPAPPSGRRPTLLDRPAPPSGRRPTLLDRPAPPSGRRPDPLHVLAERLHDHSITEALDEVLESAARAGRATPVAVMGGHALHRDSNGYRHAAELGRALGRSPARFTVLTGGGPGAMEAVPLGVRCAPLPDDALPAVLRQLSTAPTFHGADSSIVDCLAVGRWLAAAVAVSDAGLAQPADRSTPVTIGIPTWFYGHEPPNPFCDVHAKYFANSVREDGLLTVASGGVVYTPGSAGTVQEIFADYAQNHYGSVGPPAPMIFLDANYWTSEIPAAPLVQQLAKGRDAEPWIMITDDVAEAVALLESYADVAHS